MRIPYEQYRLLFQQVGHIAIEANRARLRDLLNTAVVGTRLSATKQDIILRCFSWRQSGRYLGLAENPAYMLWQGLRWGTRAFTADDYAKLVVLLSIECSEPHLVPPPPPPPPRRSPPLELEIT